MICIYKDKYHVLSGDKKLIPVNAIIEKDDSVSLIPIKGERVPYSDDLGCEITTLEDIKKKLKQRHEFVEDKKPVFDNTKRPGKTLKKFM